MVTIKSFQNKQLALLGKYFGFFELNTNINGDCHYLFKIFKAKGNTRLNRIVNIIFTKDTLIIRFSRCHQFLFPIFELLTSCDKSVTIYIKQIFSSYTLFPPFSFFSLSDFNHCVVTQTYANNIYYASNKNSKKWYTSCLI